MALLTITQQQGVKPISPNWASFTKENAGLTNYEQIETEVEEKELKSLLGVALLQDLQKNPTTANNIKLLDGDSFKDCSGNTIDQKGVRYVIAYLVFTKYVGETLFGDTFTGIVRKNRNETETASTGDIKKLQLDSREISLQEFELIKQYLDENSDEYPLWNKTQSKTPYLPKLTGVKRTIL